MSTNSQLLRYILSLRMNSRFITSRSGEKPWEMEMDSSNVKYLEKNNINEPQHVISNNVTFWYE